MKRTLLALASLTAIILLSCNSIENSSSAEDLNFSQKPTLQKGSVPIDPYAVPPPTPAASYQKTCSGTMSVTAPYGTYAWSSEACCDFTNLSSGSLIEHVEATSSIVIGSVGAFTTSHFKIKCGNYADTLAWNGWSPTVSTSSSSPPSNIHGKPANVRCCLSFYGKCNATGSGGAACKESRNNVNMTMYYY
jgi:hypothetical protein